MSASSTDSRERLEARLPAVPPGRGEAGERARPTVWQWASLALLIATTFLAYQPAWTGKPIWDDDMHITRPELRSLQGLARIWTEPRSTAQYYPLIHTAFWVEYKLWGNSATGYHVVNLLFHVASALLFLKLLQRLRMPGAWLAAMIFALHPVHAESVAWITEQKNTLSTLLYLAALWNYLEFDRRRSQRTYAVALLLFVLALLTKTVTGTLPAALLVIFWWQRGRLSWKSDVAPLLPFILLGALAGAITAWWESSVNLTHGGAFDLGWGQRFLIAGRAVWFHLGKLLWPAGLCFSYPRWQPNTAQWWQYLFPLGFAALLFWLWRLRLWNRAPLAAGLFFVATLFPTLGFFNLYTFRYSFVADHYQYQASLGIIALAAAGIVWCVRRLGPRMRPIGYALCGALLAALWSLTWQQAHIYANPETLWQATLARNPSAWIAHSNLGWDLLRAGRPEAAIPHFEAALRIGPGAHEVENNWGLALVLLGRPETEAERHFLASLHLNPQFGNAHYNYANLLFRTGRLEAAVKHYRAALRSPVRDTSLDPALHNNFGSALAQLGRFDEAAVQYQQSLRLRSDGVAWKNLGTARLDQGRLDDAIQCLQASLQFTNSADIHLDLALAFKAKGNGEQAAAHFAEALRLDPGSAAAHFQFGLFLYQQHRPAETLAHWREALKLKPDSPDLLNGLAWILATCPDPKRRDGAQAVQFAERASTLSGSPASSLDTLAAAYAEAGRFTDAVAAAQKALALAEATGQTNTLARFRSRLQLYRQHIAYHEANEP